MRPSSARIGRIAAPLRVMAQRFALLLLAGASITLMVLARAGYPPLESVRTAVIDVAAPVLEAATHPVAAFNRTVGDVTAFANLYEENARLREENERLRNWQSQARLLAQENAAFRGLLRAQPEPGMTYVSGRIIGDSGGPFVRAVLLNAGRREGIHPGVAAVTGDGLVGRVVDAGTRSARVLLLTDLNSRVPVVVESSRYRAILEGDNTNALKLGFLPDTDNVQVGDRIVTSGHGGLFPAGLPVGVVSGIDADTAVVAPYVRFDRLEFIRVLLFDFPALNPESGESPGAAAAAGAGG